MRIPRNFSPSIVQVSAFGSIPSHGLRVLASLACLAVFGGTIRAGESPPPGASVSGDVKVGARGSVGAGAEAAMVRGPYLQMGTPASIVVRWRTDLASDSRVLYGPAPDDLSFSVILPALTTEHIVTVTHLDPDTRYYYAVGTSSTLLVGADSDHFFVTAPNVGMATPTRIWILGDSGTADGNARAVRDAYYSFTGNHHTDLWLMLGDNAYSSGTESQYQSAVFNTYPEMLRKSVLWPTLGNHDAASADSGTQSGVYYDIFSLPRAGEAGGLASGTEAYYSFDHGNIHFIVLDSHDSDRAANGPMATWMEQDLATTAQDWIIAYWHHPPYSKGSHDSDSESRLIDMRTNFLPILEDYGVDLVFSGHSHSYERSFLIDGHYDASATFDESMKLDGGDGQEGGDGMYQKPAAGGAPHAGAVYTVAGSSGKTSGGSLNHPAMYTSLNVPGSVVLDVAEKRLDATFLDDEGVVRDRHTIIKGNGCSDDRDSDGACDSSDNCLDVANLDQSDFDGDGVGDACENGVTVADIDISGRVDGYDLVRLARSFGTQCGDADYRSEVDLDRNCDIDGDDLSLLAAYFGESSN